MSHMLGPRVSDVPTFSIDGNVGMSDSWGMDVQTLIDKAGGRPKFQELIGVARTTVLDWERLGRIPANRVAQISQALDLPLADVIRLAPEPPQRKVEVA